MCEKLLKYVINVWLKPYFYHLFLLVIHSFHSTSKNSFPIHKGVEKIGGKITLNSNQRNNKSRPRHTFTIDRKAADGILHSLKFLNLSVLYFTFFKVKQAKGPGTTCVPFAVLASVLYTLTALSPAVSLFRKPGRRIVVRVVGSSWAFIAVLIFVYKGGSSFMVVGLIDSLDFPWVFQNLLTLQLIIIVSSSHKSSSRIIF